MAKFDVSQLNEIAREATDVVRKVADEAGRLLPVLKDGQVVLVDPATGETVAVVGDDADTAARREATFGDIDG